MADARAEYERELAEYLPTVDGDYMLISIGDFEHRCLITIGSEQVKIAPDTALIGLLCEAVRLSREFIRVVKNG